MTHLQGRNDSEQFEVTPESDSLVNDALTAMAQEVAELLKQAYPVQQNKHANKDTAYNHGVLWEEGNSILPGLLPQQHQSIDIRAIVSLEQSQSELANPIRI